MFLYKLIIGAFSFKISVMKSIFDAFLLVLSINLSLTLFGNVATFGGATIYYKSFHSIGLGSVETTFANSPLVNVCSKFIDKIFEPTARFLNFEKVFSRN